eukprot:3309520-Rhodomonas_salina.1
MRKNCPKWHARSVVSGSRAQTGLALKLSVGLIRIGGLLTSDMCRICVTLETLTPFMKIVTMFFSYGPNSALSGL